jgi:hypothetical protein
MEKAVSGFTREGGRKMKKILFVLIFAVLNSFSQGELIQREMTSTPQVSNSIVTYNGSTNQISVPEGKILKVIDFYYDRFLRPSGTGGDVYTGLKVKYGSSTNSHSAYVWGTSYGSFVSPNDKMFYGPCVIDIYLNDNRQHSPAGIEGAYVHYIFDLKSYGSDASSVSSLIPSSSIVVPSNAIGDVDVLLEQSNDMITWTQCLPGTYNASTQKRFFRVRAVEK